MRPDDLRPAAAADQGLAGVRPRVVFVVNVDHFFLSHRLPLGRAARDAGAEVIVAAADTGRAGEIRAEGFGFEPLPISRHGTRVAGEARAFAALLGVYGRLRPDLVHHVTIKPVLYGSLSARLRRTPAVVNAVSGLGSFLTSDDRRRLLRRLVDGTYRAALRHPRSRTIFQNPEDHDLFLRRGFIGRENGVLIRGAGVDCTRFLPTPEPEGAPVVMLASRMLWDKGVGTFVKAARLLAAQGVRARFVLVGDTDEENFMAVPGAQLRAWAAEGVVEWWGVQQEMHRVLPQAAIVVLPSLREGLPKVLLEAAACGRPMVASDVPGCREIVRPGVTGERVPFGDARSLAEALGALLGDRARRASYGAAARAIAEAEFSEALVVRQTLDVYRELLGTRWPRSANGG